jgi:hypothetical protein|uniref:Uncharacterized protein n=1 Tax=viral metagenome TaxID=1070528 RepID=A0A6C0BGP5_9ZZZZ
MNSVTAKDNISKSLEFTIYDTLAEFQRFIQKKDKKLTISIINNIEQFKNDMNEHKSVLKLVGYNSIFKNASLDDGDELRAERPLIVTR